MINDSNSSEQPAPETAAPRIDPSLTNPNLSGKLQAECEALRNDLQQAQELAADFQRQLASKSNEVATMKHFFERTRDHLMKLQNSIKELRQERHRLANEVMHAAAVEKKLTAERDLLRDDLQLLQAKEKLLTSPAAEPLPHFPIDPTNDTEINWVG
jgi:chromosome segregation ATPase